MAEGVRAFQRSGAGEFSVSLSRTDGGFQYEILGLPSDIAGKEVAEILFSVAMDIQDREAKSAKREACSEG